MSFRFDHGDDYGDMAEINVTPLVDVMLVLLIIFMVAAPLSTVVLPVNLPSSTAIPQQKPDKPTYVTIKSDLAVAVGETQVKRVDIVQFLDAMSDQNMSDQNMSDQNKSDQNKSDQGKPDQGASDQGKDRHIFLRADRTVPYGELMDVLERLRIGGYHKIALVALEAVPDDSAPRAAPDAKP
jgi:biopolymer transport protein ExbD